MKKIILFWALLLAALMTTAAALQYQQNTFSQKLIRLHVVANSDSEEDQTLKLYVRDAVIRVTETVSDQHALAAKLPGIQRAAEECLRQHGCKDTVSVTLGKERFPTRVYDTFSLPAGMYQSLRVTIGEGKGRNWWCVAFPSICFCATAADFEEAAAAGGFTEEEISLITEDSAGYKLKFKTLEVLDKLKKAIFQ